MLSSRVRRAVAIFSLSELAKYVRLTLALWIGFEVPFFFGHPDVAVALAGSAMLTLAFASSISAARGFFVKRVVSNVVAMPLGTLVIWLTAPNLWLGAILLPVLVFAIVRVRPSLFQMTSVSIPMTLVLYTGEHIPLLEQRLIAVVLGMLLGLAIQQLVVPPDHGYRANTLVIEVSRQASDTLAQHLEGNLERDEFRSRIERLRVSNSNLKESFSLLELDLGQKWAASHLRLNQICLPVFRCRYELGNVVISFLETIKILQDQSSKLDLKWKEEYMAGLKRLLEAHLQFAQLIECRIEIRELEPKSIQALELQQMVESLPVTDVLTSACLGYLMAYGVLLCRLSDLHASKTT